MVASKVNALRVFRVVVFWIKRQFGVLVCIVLKKVYTYWLKILIQVYKLKLILNTVYTFLFLHGWVKRKQALLRSILPGITPVCNEV